MKTAVLSTTVVCSIAAAVYFLAPTAGSQRSTKAAKPTASTLSSPSTHSAPFEPLARVVVKPVVSRTPAQWQLGLARGEDFIVYHRFQQGGGTYHDIVIAEIDGQTIPLDVSLQEGPAVSMSAKHEKTIRPTIVAGASVAAFQNGANVYVFGSRSRKWTCANLPYPAAPIVYDHAVEIKLQSQTLRYDSAKDSWQFLNATSSGSSSAPIADYRNAPSRVVAIYTERPLLSTYPSYAESENVEIARDTGPLGTNTVYARSKRIQCSPIPIRFTNPERRRNCPLFAARNVAGFGDGSDFYVFNALKEEWTCLMAPEKGECTARDHQFLVYTPSFTFTYDVLSDRWSCEPKEWRATATMETIPRTVRIEHVHRRSISTEDPYTQATESE